MKNHIFRIVCEVQLSKTRHYSSFHGRLYDNEADAISDAKKLSTRIFLNNDGSKIEETHELDRSNYGLEVVDKKGDTLMSIKVYPIEIIANGYRYRDIDIVNDGVRYRLELSGGISKLFSDPMTLSEALIFVDGMLFAMKYQDKE